MVLGIMPLDKMTFLMMGIMTISIMSVMKLSIMSIRTLSLMSITTLSIMTIRMTLYVMTLSKMACRITKINAMTLILLRSA
jgi:hypothetical protein